MRSGLLRVVQYISVNRPVIGTTWYTLIRYLPTFFASNNTACQLSKPSGNTINALTTLPVHPVCSSFTMLWTPLIALSLVHLCASNPLNRRWGDLADKHSWVDIPRGWEYHSAAPADHLFNLRIGLKQDRIDDLIASLLETSDPTHEK